MNDNFKSICMSLIIFALTVVAALIISVILKGL